MRIERFLTTSAERMGGEPALVAGGRSHSYAQLSGAAERIAAALAERGVKRGDRVAVLMDTTPAAVAVTFGVLMAGAVVCVVAKTADADALASLLAEHRPIAFAVDAKFASLAAEGLANSLDVRIVLLNGAGAIAANPNCLSVDDLITRLGPARTIAAGVGSEDAAMVLGGLDTRGDEQRPITLSHFEVVAGAGSTAPRQGLVLHSMFSFPGFCHLVEAIRIGVTVILDGPFELRHGGSRAPQSASAMFAPLFNPA